MTRGYIGCKTKCLFCLAQGHFGRTRTVDGNPQPSLQASYFLRQVVCCFYGTLDTHIQTCLLTICVMQPPCSVTHCSSEM